MANDIKRTINKMKSNSRKVGNAINGISLGMDLIIHEAQLQQHYQRCVDRAQKVVDSEVLRYCDGMVPLQTGMLKKSGTLGTVIGSGNVQYIAPYAASQYYNTATSRPYDSNRGAKWFERMKTAHKDDILKTAQKAITGGI